MKQNTRESWRIAMLILKQKFRSHPLQSLLATVILLILSPLALVVMVISALYKLLLKVKRLFSSLVAMAYMCGETDRTKIMKGYRDNRKLIHYDTEQGKFHAHKVFRRVTDACGHSDDYLTYALRQYSPMERLDFIDWHLNNTEDIGLVIIDGIVDLMLDSNDLKESSKVVQYLMKWTQELNIHIITAIHSNWNSEKPTGHLGSFLEKKAETQIALELSDQKHIAIVKCMRSRGFPFEKFAFEVDNQGLPNILESIPEEINKDKYLKI